MHLVKHVQQPPIRVIQVLAEAVDRHDHPVCVAIFTFFERWIWIADDGFLSKRDDPISEAGEFAGHKLPFPLHSLVS